MLRDSDRLYLQATVELARRGMYSCTPNPRVGCIIVRDGEVLGRGWHLRAGEGHAEVNALADAGDKDVRGALSDDQATTSNLQNSQLVQWSDCDRGNTQ